MNGCDRSMILLSVNWPWRSWKLPTSSERAGSSRKANANTKKGTTPTQAHENLRGAARAPTSSCVSTQLVCDIALRFLLRIACYVLRVACRCSEQRHATHNTPLRLRIVHLDDRIPALGDDLLCGVLLLDLGEGRLDVQLGRRQLGGQVGRNLVVLGQDVIPDGVAIAFEPDQLALIGA